MSIPEALVNCLTLISWTTPWATNKGQVRAFLQAPQGKIESLDDLELRVEAFDMLRHCRTRVSASISLPF
jgi:hypothetical protein